MGSSADRAAVTRRPTGVDTDRVLTVPNALSFLRLCGVPVVLWLILGPQADVLAVVVLALSGATDWLDGYIARRWHQRSRLGQVLDPLADRLYILATILGLAMRDLIPWWLVIALVARDVVMALLVPALRTRGYTSLPVHFLGKAATFCLLYAFPLILLGATPEPWAIVARVIGWAFALWGTGLYWYSALLYLHQAYELFRTAPAQEGERRKTARPAREE